jgi:phospholipid-translocating ATPase
MIKNGTLRDVKSSKIRAGDIIIINAKERVPADLVILSTSEPSGSIFIKTDQLDGETDWKIRRAVRCTHQVLAGNMFAGVQDGVINYAPACDDIYEFIGSMTWKDRKESLNLDNTAWANTVLAAGQLIGIVIFTGSETRVNMNSREPNTKVGRFDH